MDLSPTRIHVVTPPRRRVVTAAPSRAMGGAALPSSSSTRYEPPLALALAATAGGAEPWPDASHEPARREAAAPRSAAQRRHQAQLAAVPPPRRPPTRGGLWRRRRRTPSVGRADGVARDAVETVVCAREGVELADDRLKLGRSSRSAATQAVAMRSTSGGHSVFSATPWVGRSSPCATRCMITYGEAGALVEQRLVRRLPRRHLHEHPADHVRLRAVALLPQHLGRHERRRPATVIVIADVRVGEHAALPKVGDLAQPRSGGRRRRGSPRAARCRA